MSLHILKMAVRVDSLPHLSEIQAARLARARAPGGTGDLRHLTRNTPRKADQILDGGSIYWVIKGYVRARQRILGFEPAINARGRPRCAIVLDPDLAPTVLKPHRAFQGWRYFEPDEAPADRIGRDPDGLDDLPSEMADELRDLGLL